MELVRFPSRGGFSVRSIILFCLTVLTTGILWTLFGSTPVHAADANWSGDVILFDNQGFVAAPSTTSSSHGIASGSTLYLYIPPVNGSITNSTEAFFIYFAPGVDPPTATSAEYVAFDYNKGTFSNPQGRRTISIDPAGTNQSMTSSCAVSGGMGWIICPISEFLAGAMDYLYGIIVQFIEVQPLTFQAGAESPLYNAWNIMRSIANVAFVIAFIIIIYSQLTSFGVSSYGLKKLIPRLIVAAVLVNVSFYVSAVAIDVSNVLGYSVQNIFDIIREQSFYVTDDTLGGTLTSTWSAVTSSVLGGTGVVLGGIWAYSSGAYFLLIPLLIGVVLTAVVVAVILAARQAIIVLLVIIAPLAFVANLLPNTEKWFTKWKDTFMTMLIFFPAFSLVFGGSQLAGQLIIQNAGGNLVMIIFGMAIQVAPLVITPILLKFSGGLLGKIGQIVNNPKKGLLDRNKNWANDRKSLVAKRTAGRDLTGRRRTNPRTWGTRMVKGSEFRRRALKDNLDEAEMRVDNRYKETGRYAGIHERTAGQELDKDRIGNTNNAHIEHLKVTPGSSLYGRTVAMAASKDVLEAAQNATNTHINNQRLNNASPLYQSTLNLEASKSALEASENSVKAFVAQQRTLAGGALRHTVEPLEDSKLRLESAQSRYNELVDSMKSTPGSALSNAAFAAQASKEAAEQAATHLQAHFDIRRRVVGSELNLSMVQGEEVKKFAEAQKSYTTTLLNDLKQAVGSNLHIETIRAEQAKLGEQVSETQVNKMVQEYKSGLAPVVPTGELSALMNSMVDDVENLAAETRGVQSAENMQKRHIAEATGATDPITGAPTARADDLLTRAAGVDPAGRTRARAYASAQINAIEDEARKNNIALLEESAAQAGVRSIDFATNLYKRFRGYTDSQTNIFHPPEDVDPSMLEAALDFIASDSGIPTLREAATDLPNGSQMRDIDSDMLRKVIQRNASAVMPKGGADLVLNNISRVSPEQMNISIAGNLTGIKGPDIASIKFGEWDYLANPTNLNAIINAAETGTPDGVHNKRSQAQYQDGMKQFYSVITNTLMDPDVFNTFSAVQQQQTIRIHEVLHAHYNEPANHIADYTRLGRK